MLVLPVSEIAAQEPSEATKKLFDAIYDGNLEKVQISIADGSDINALNAWGITPVDLAVEKGHFNIVNYLLHVRDLQWEKKKETLPIPAARFTTLSTTPDQTLSRPEPPAPSTVHVAEIYAPPPEAGPWSATVVKPESPPPFFVKGPSPFDPEPETSMTLPIIGIVRGPKETTSGKVVDTTVQAAIEVPFQEVGRKQLKPKPLPKKNVPKVVAKPQPDPQVSQSRPMAPAPSIAPVAEIYAPAPEAGPWSANVETSESPPPFVVKSPSPFDPEPETSVTLPIIGIVRGPKETTLGKVVDTTVQAAIEATFQEVGRKQLKPKPLPKKNFPKVVAKPQPDLQVAQSKPKPPQSIPIFEVVKSSSLEQTSAPVSPLYVTRAPPEIKTKILPETFTPAAPPTVSVDDLESLQVIPMQVKLPPKIIKKILAPDTSKAKVTRIDNSKSAAPTKIVEGTPDRSPVQIGTTTLPGKRRDQEGFFNRLMSIFSSNKEETTSAEKSDKNGEPTKKEIGDWSVRNVQKAQVIPRNPTKKIVRELPDNRLFDVVLNLGRTMTLGKAQPPEAPAPWYYKSCTNKKQSTTVFCIEPLDWPENIQPYLLTDSILYEGTQSIVRYDEGAATYFHFLFPSQSYPLIIKYFSSRYGTPTQKLKRFIAPLAEPRRINPTVIWQSIAPGTNLLTTLEVRMYDDNRGGFPDTKRGAVYLYHEWSEPVFQQLSMVELMLLRSEVKLR